MIDEYGKFVLYAAWHSPTRAVPVVLPCWPKAVAHASGSRTNVLGIVLPGGFSLSE